MNDGAQIDTTAASTLANLSVHTNNLTLGDNTNGTSVLLKGNNVTIDDASMVAGSGLHIHAVGGVSANSVFEYINAANGALNISATNADNSGDEDADTW